MVSAYRKRTDHRRGASAVEFAIVAPVFVFVLIALVVYGTWLWMAQSAQSIASDTARAAIGGLDDAERERLAQEHFILAVSQGGVLDPARARLAADSHDGLIRVQVAYDVSDHPLMAMAAVVPSPPRRIERHAAVRIGGY